MSSKVQKLFEALPQPGSIDELGVLIDLVRDLYDLEHVVYLALSLGHERMERRLKSQPRMGVLAGEAGFWRDQGAGLVAVTYGADWAYHYESEGYDRIDPILSGAPRSFLPVDWKTLKWDTKQKRKFLAEASDAGIGNQGYTVPVRGPSGQQALFTINKNCTDSAWEKFLEEFSSDFLVIGHFLHQKVLEAEQIGNDTGAPQLSSRERDVLTYLSNGKTREQVAHELGISSSTIRVYIDSARHKLGALNLNHAIAIGVRKGLVN